MNKKKIGIVIPSLNHGGAEKSALILAEKLQNEYQSVDLISLCVNLKKLENDKINLISLEKTRVLFSIFQLYKLIKVKKYDCIITGLSHLNLIFLFLNFFFKKNNKILLLLHFHNIPNINFSNFKERIINFFVFKFIKSLNYKNIRILTVSNSIKDYISSNYSIDKNKITLIYPTIDFNKIEKLKLDKFSIDKKNEKIILTVGRLSIQKNHALLIKSLAEVRKSVNCKLIIIGNGILKKKLKKLTNDLNLSDYVNFIDKTDNPYKFFNNSDIFVLPSLWEGFGLVLIEALYCEMKIVATDCPGSPKELLSGIETALLSKNNDFLDLSAKILEMLKRDIDNTKSIKDKTKIKFSLNNHINEYIKLINNS